MDRSRIRIAPSVILILLALTSLVPGTTSHDCGETVLIPAGTFLMGILRPYPNDEGPQHDVYLQAYRIDRCEVTNAEYRQCVVAGACSEPADLRPYADPGFADHPVVFVT